MIENACAWVYGDDIDTDVLAPAPYLTRPVEESALHCLEALDPDFATSVQPGDVFVAGENLGVGSSRENAPQHLQHLGVSVVLARSYGRIFYRNAMNLGLPALVCPRANRIATGDRLDVDPLSGDVRNLTTGERLHCEPLPEHLIAMLADGGLIAHLEKRFTAAAKKDG
ncbi:MAG: 3-isopropylmalate dehydratase [Gammaproteobacteria bacterium]